MSGGHYDYLYFRIKELANDIERDFKKDGKFTGEDWSNYGQLKEYDYLEGLDKYQREKVLEEIRLLIRDLKSCEERSKSLEWFMSGDIGADTLLRDFEAIKKNYK